MHILFLLPQSGILYPVFYSGRPTSDDYKVTMLTQKWTPRSGYKFPAVKDLHQWKCFKTVVFMIGKMRK